jgi:hypothetical protein
MTWSYIKGIEICGHKNDTEMLVESAIEQTDLSATK